MATPSSPNDAVTADDVLTVQFTHIRKGGYDTQEVDGFLDRVAVTLDRDAAVLPPGSMTGEDVRTVQFNQVKRGGYDTQEVDNFLDQVVALLTSVRSAPTDVMSGDAPAAEGAPPAPAAPEEAPLADPVPVAATAPAPAPAPGAGVDLGFEDVAPQSVAPPAEKTAAPAAAAGMATGTPQLHDPGGAAQKLLAAAQQAADILTAEATSYHETTIREADDYAAATRGEADEHAARVTSAAEAQAASIREVAAEEARRVAEEARATLINDIDALDARKRELAGAAAELERTVALERAGLLATIDSLRDRVASELPSSPADTPADGASSGEATGEADGGATEVHGEVAAAFASDDDVADPEPAVVAPAEAEDVIATEPEAEPLSEPGLVDGLGAEELVAEDAAAEEVAEEVTELTAEELLAPEEPPTAEPSPPVDTQDDMASASRSVFDLADDAPTDDAAEWVEEAFDDTGRAEPPVEAPATGGGLFDIEADPEWNESGDSPPQAGGAGQPAPSGDSFFDELRQADAEAEGLGPLDDDTDAALSAFFEGDEPDSGGGRWRDRFGPGKD